MFDILWNIKYIYSLALLWPSFFTNTRYRLFTRIPDADAAIHVHAKLLSSVECIAKKTSNRIIKMRAGWSSRFIYETLAGLIYIAIFYWHIDRLYVYIFIGSTVPFIQCLSLKDCRKCAKCHITIIHSQRNFRSRWRYIYLLWKWKYYKIFRTDIKQKKIKLDKLTY